MSSKSVVRWQLHCDQCSKEWGNEKEEGDVDLE